MLDFISLYKLHGNKNKLLQDHNNITLFDQEEYKFLSDISSDDLKKLFEIVYDAMKFAFGNTNNEVHEMIMQSKHNSEFRNKYKDQILQLIKIFTKLNNTLKNNAKVNNRINS